MGTGSSWRRPRAATPSCTRGAPPPAEAKRCGLSSAPALMHTTPWAGACGPPVKIRAPRRWTYAQAVGLAVTGSPCPPAGSFGIFLLNRFPILGRKNVPTTVCSTAGAGIFPSLIEFIAVIVGKLFAGVNISESNNPDTASGFQHFTVRIAAVIDVPCFISEPLAVDIPLVTEGKNVHVALS